MRRDQQSGVKRVTAIALAFGMVISGCARAGTGSVAQQPSVTGTGSTSTAYQAADQQQSDTCDGVAPPSTLELVPRDAVITDVAICAQPVEKYVAGEGSFAFVIVRVLPRAKFPEFMAGLSLPDASGTADTCSASLSVVTDFTVTLADGSRIRPGVPGDGCHPREEATKAFNGLGTMPIRSERRGAQARTELEVRTGCESDGKSVAVWAEAVDAGGTPPPLPSGAISVCRYRNGPDQSGPLSAVGLPARAAVGATWPTASDVASPSCDLPADLMAGPVVDWVTIRQAPTPPYQFDGTGAPMIALVELGGCRRLVTPQGGVVGSLGRGTVDALAALADSPVG